MQKTTLEPKLAGAWLGEHPKKFGTLYLSLQPLKLATSNLVYKCGLASSLPRNNVLDHNWWGSGLYKYCYTILLFHLKHTVAVVTHARVLQNFYTTWVRGVDCQKQRLGPQFEGGWAREHPKNLGPLRISATVEASNFKFGTQIGFGTSLQKTTFRTKISGDLG